MAIVEEEQLRTLFDFMPQLGWAARPDGWIDYYNRRWYEYTGTKPEDMEGWGWQSVHDPEVLPLVMTEWQRSIATGEPFEMAFPLRRHDGVFRWFLTRVTPMRDASGAIVRWVGINTDIDDQKRAEAALAAANRAKDDFLANVSHELRTPLTLMLGPLEDALANANPTLDAVALHTFHRNTLRLHKLVDSLLDYARVGSGLVEPTREPIDLAAFTVDLAGQLRAMIEQAGLRLAVDVDPVGTRLADTMMWERIVLNLLSNAFKFTFEGEIRVTLRGDGERVVLEVADTGVGIPKDELDRVFDRFHRVKDARSRTHEGSGIGLALVKQLAQRLGGDVSVESTLGKGTTFRVTIVAKADVATGVTHRTTLARAYVSEAAAWGTAPEHASGGGDARVLVADDNADMRDYIARLLRDLATVVTVGDGEQALAAARAQRFDAIITDVMMPRLDGFALLAALRADPATASTPVIILSARAGEEARIEGLTAGAVEYLVKPFAARELVVRVQAQIAAQRTRIRIESERNALKRLLASAPAVINFLRGPELVIEVAHPQSVQRLGGRSIEGKPLLEAVPELRDQPYPELLARVYRTGERVSGREALVRIRGPNGLEDTYWNYDYLPVRDASGAIEGVMTCDIEVTDSVLAKNRLRESEAQLKLALVRAEEASRAKDEFLAMLGHELRNPLAPIVTALQLLDLRGNPTLARERAVIRRQVQHLEHLLDDLLDVSRITRGTITLKREPVELADAVAKAIEVASPLLEQHRHVLDVDVPQTGLVIDGDPVRLAQILSNVLTNAAKYTPPEGRISIAGARIGERIEVRVRDNGMGISAEMLPRVFELFSQAPQAIDRAKGGLGLGLAIVKNLVSLHGGEVSAHSAGLGQGTEIIVALPAAATVRASAPVDTTPAARPTTSRRVLIVDDNEDAAQMMAAFLDQHGYQTEVVGDGLTAIAAAQRFVPDVVLLDIGLPVLDGYQVVGELRALDQTRGAFIAAVTGYGQREDRERSLAAGFDLHVVKPIDVTSLLAKIDQHFR